MYIKEHWLTGRLGDRSVKQLHCDKTSGRLECPDTIVLHYTAGGNAMSSAHYLARADTDTSAHLVIARDGGVIQLLPFDTIAWHAGESRFNGRTSLNRYSIGIELDNAGQLHRRKNQFFSWFNREYMPNEVYTHCENGRASYWHRYTNEQIAMLTGICQLLTVAYPVHYLLRHSDISRRKIDPGPAFPFDDFQKDMKNRLEK